MKFDWIGDKRFGKKDSDSISISLTRDRHGYSNTGEQCKIY